MLITLNPKEKTRITIKKEASGGITLRVQGYTKLGNVPFDRSNVYIDSTQPVDIIVETEEVK